VTDTIAEPEVTAPETTTAVAVRQARDLATAIPAKLQYARALADSGLLPAQFRRQPGNVLYAVEYGEMLGLAPMAAITGIHVIEGKPTASAGLISALVRRAGHKLRAWGDTRSATCVIIRADDPDFEFKVTWTLNKNSDGNPSAEVAGLLGKDVWKKYGASMLKSRAISQCARDACEEVLFGLHYTPEELGAAVDEEGNIVTVEVVEDGAVTDLEWLNRSMASVPVLTSLDDLRALWAESAELVGRGQCTRADAEALQDVLRKRMSEVRDAGAKAAAPEAQPEAQASAEPGYMAAAKEAAGRGENPVAAAYEAASAGEAEPQAGVPDEMESAQGDDPEVQFVQSFAARTADATADQIRGMRTELGKAVAAKVLSPDIANDLGRSLTDRLNHLRSAA
jgi:hypothetical protein